MKRGGRIPRRTPLKSYTPLHSTNSFSAPRQSLPKRSKRLYTKIWSTPTADTRFSLFIRARDEICRRCKIAPSHDNSHYWRRGHSGTRFDPKNCVGLCRDCHDLWEHQQNNEYKAFMIEWLGQEEYDLLERRARTFKKRTEAVLECMELLRVTKEVMGSK